MTPIQRGFAALFALVLAAVGAAAQAQTHAQRPGPVETYFYYVYSQPKPGQEAEYNRWYDNQHIQDVTAVPGIVDGQRYVLAEPELLPAKPTRKALPRYLIVYRIRTDDLGAVMAEVRRRRTAGETLLSPAFDETSVVSFVYRALGSEASPARAPGEAGQAYLHHVFNAPVAGQEAEFNRWYDQVHLGEMLSAPGFYRAQRLELAIAAPPGAPGVAFEPSRYAAYFLIRTPDPARDFGTYRKVQEGMHFSPAHDRANTQGYTYQALGPRVLGDDVRRARAARGR